MSDLYARMKSRLKETPPEPQREGIFATVFGRDTYDPMYDTAEYRDQVKARSAPQRNTSSFGVVPDAFLSQAMAMAGLSRLTEEANAAVEALPALFDSERDYWYEQDRESALSRDARLLADAQDAQEFPAAATAAGIGGALYGGLGLMRAAGAGGAALTNSGARGSQTAGGALSALGPVAPNTMGGRLAQNVAQGAIYSVPYAYDQGLNVGATAAAGAALAPPAAALFRGALTAPVMTGGIVGGGGALAANQFADADLDLSEIGGLTVAGLAAGLAGRRGVSALANRAARREARELDQLSAPPQDAPGVSAPLASRQALPRTEMLKQIQQEFPDLTRNETLQVATEIRDGASLVVAREKAQSLIAARSSAPAAALGTDDGAMPAIRPPREEPGASRLPVAAADEDPLSAALERNPSMDAQDVAYLRGLQEDGVPPGEIEEAAGRIAAMRRQLPAVGQDPIDDLARRYPNLQKADLENVRRAQKAGATLAEIDEIAAAASRLQKRIPDQDLPVGLSLARRVETRNPGGAYGRGGTLVTSTGRRLTGMRFSDIGRMIQPLTRQIQTLRAQKQQAAQEMLTLQQQLREMRASGNRSQQDFEDLYKRYTQLADENSGLSGEINLLREEIRDLQANAAPEPQGGQVVEAGRPIAPPSLPVFPEMRARDGFRVARDFNDLSPERQIEVLNASPESVDRTFVSALRSQREEDLLEFRMGDGNPELDPGRPFRPALTAEDFTAEQAVAEANRLSNQALPDLSPDYYGMPRPRDLYLPGRAASSLEDGLQRQREVDLEQRQVPAEKVREQAEAEVFRLSGQRGRVRRDEPEGSNDPNIITFAETKKDPAKNLANYFFAKIAQRRDVFLRRVREEVAHGIWFLRDGLPTGYRRLLQKKASEWAKTPEGQKAIAVERQAARTNSDLDAEIFAKYLSRGEHLKLAEPIRQKMSQRLADWLSERGDYWLNQRLAQALADDQELARRFAQGEMAPYFERAERAGRPSGAEGQRFTARTTKQGAAQRPDAATSAVDEPKASMGSRYTPMRRVVRAFESAGNDLGAEVSRFVTRAGGKVSAADAEGIAAALRADRHGDAVRAIADRTGLSVRDVRINLMSDMEIQTPNAFTSGAVLASAARPTTAGERARAEAAEEFGVKLSRGQLEGNAEQQAREEGYRRGGYGGNAQRVMERFDDTQREQIDDAISDLAFTMTGRSPEIPTDPMGAAIEVGEGVARRDAARRGWGSRKYDKLETASDSLGFQSTSLPALFKALDDTVADFGFKIQEDRIFSVVDQVKGNLQKAVNEEGGLSFEAIDTIRSGLLKTQRSLKASDPSAAYEVGRLRSALDDFVDERMGAGSKAVGSEAAAEAQQFDALIRLGANGPVSEADSKKLAKAAADARKYWRNYKEQFDAAPGAVAADRQAVSIIKRMADRDMSPEEIVRFVFGLQRVGESETSRLLLRRLNKILNYSPNDKKQNPGTPADWRKRMESSGMSGMQTVDNDPGRPSPQWQAIRAAAFRRILEAPAGKNRKNYKQMADSIDRFLDDRGTTAAGILFEKAEQAKLRRLSQVLRTMQPKEGTTNPSGTAWAAARLIQSVFGAMAGASVGNLAGGPLGGVVGMLAGASTGSPVSGMMRNAAGQRAAAAATGPQAMPRTVAEEGAINWAAAIGRLQASTQPNRL